ncbi:MAG: hypothetical protein R8F63_21765 [Acidimicrobiales bacterium]|nr:hypothetical protein [Acidimicrobiales bacterium]
MNRLGALCITIALAASACSGASQESPWAIEQTTTTGAAPTTEPVTNDDEPASEPAIEPPPGVEVVDDDCFEGEDRCGRVLVPQTPGSPDLVAIGFRVHGADGTGTPLVFLESGFGDFAPTDVEFPGRPVVILGSRTMWPGGPAMSCPEWFALAAEADDDEVVAATTGCLDRHTDAGVDVDGALRNRQIDDVVLALRALGIDDLDLVAANIRADVVPGVMRELTVRHHILIEPSLAPSDPILRSVGRTVQSLDYAWETCRSSANCASIGTIDEFLDLIGTLDAAPLVFTDPFNGEERRIDTEWMVSALHREVDRPETVGFLPTLHQALLDRDADTVSQFITAGGGGDATVEWLGQACARWATEPADFAGFHDALRIDAVDSMDFFRVNCPVWYDGEAEEADDHTPGLIIVTASTPDSERLRALADPLVVEQTVGSPTHSCIVEAITSHLGDGGPNPTCAEPLRIADRTSVELVPGEYVLDDRAVSLLVPDSWTDSGFGTWWRDADPVDLTNLDVYLFDAAGLEQTRNDFVSEWGMTDPQLTEQLIDERLWLLARGGDDFDTTGDTRQAIAVGGFGDSVVVMVLQATTDDIDLLVDAVLVPAMTSAAVS